MAVRGARVHPQRDGTGVRSAGGAGAARAPAAAAGFRHFGAQLVSEADGPHGRRITLQGQPELAAAPVVVPADPSSAAFPMVAALIAAGSDVILTGVMTNPLRTGLIATLREMGASIETLDTRSDAGESMAG